MMKRAGKGITRREMIAAGVAAAAVPAVAAASPDAEFTAAANKYIARYLESEPEVATNVGDHRYDGRLSDPSAAGRERALAVHRDFLKRLDAIEPARLRLQNRIDYQIARTRAQSAVWNETVL